MSSIVKFIEMESRTVVARSYREELLWFNGYRVSVLQDEKVLEIGHTTM